MENHLCSIAVYLLVCIAFNFILLSCISENDILWFGFIGGGQAVWGMLQLYGFASSYHKVFAVTGSFYNPGPYTGYLAVIFPICLRQLLVTRNVDKYIWMMFAVLLFSMIPAGMSRSAWGALIISSSFVLSIHFQWIERLKIYCKLHVKNAIFCTVLLLMTGGFAANLLFSMKSDSAYGRLFIWKQTLGIVVQSPISGYGPGSFPQMYGQKQSSYFAQGDYEEWEERVAGSPICAFNEYLQLAVEGGLILLLLGCAFIFFTFRKGLLTKQYGVCGGLLSLYIFAFSAYPFQVLPFGMIGILLSSLCVSTYTANKYRYFFQKIISYVGIILLFAISVSCVCLLKDVKNYKDRVHYAYMLYSDHVYQEALSAFKFVYEKIKHNPKFLLRYARSLMEQKQYSEAIEVLERAEKVCCDVAILNTKAFCYQQLGQYEQAELFFVQSTHRLPVRIYPYYMLAKLYSDSAYYNKDKLKQMSLIVLTKEPKVYSNAIKEMRDEIRKLSIKSDFN
ncbi:O-antigen ligase family protein [Bacteroides sp.]|uniref:O-antigen ligase family protein n=1 Tax=Bacteroides sp. TaxID=29523 RepID=UPI0025B82E2C|nr:O-antigen ligase family protein [Bacteroides sp.]